MSKVHEDDSHEGILEAVIREMLLDGGQSFAEWAEQADAAKLYDRDGEDVYPQSAQTFEAAGVLTQDRGVMVRMSDGSEFTLTIGRYRNPTR